MRDKLFTQIYRDLYGDAMLVPTRISTNMAYGNQQKNLLKSVNLLLEELINIKVILFLIHELFREQNSPKNSLFQPT